MAFFKQKTGTMGFLLQEDDSGHCGGWRDQGKVMWTKTSQEEKRDQVEEPWTGGGGDDGCLTTQDLGS